MRLKKHYIEVLDPTRAVLVMDFWTFDEMYYEWQLEVPGS